MGWVRHNAIIVTTGYAHEHLEAARAHAMALGMAVSEIVTSPINGYQSFMVAPDGSKEGWAHSAVADAQRHTFEEWLDSQAYEDGSTRFAWCDVWYGSDDKGADVENHAWRSAAIREKHRKAQGES